MPKYGISQLLDDLNPGELTDPDILLLVKRRGFTLGGRPTIWGHNFAEWFLAGGREEITKAQKEREEYSGADERNPWPVNWRVINITINTGDRDELDRQMEDMRVRGPSEAFHRMLWGRVAPPAKLRRPGRCAGAVGIHLSSADDGELTRQMHITGVTDHREMFRRLLWDGLRMVDTGGPAGTMHGTGGLTGRMGLDTLLAEPVISGTTEAGDALGKIVALIAGARVPSGACLPEMTRRGYTLALIVARRHADGVAAGKIPVTVADAADAGFGPDDGKALDECLLGLRRLYAALLRRAVSVSAGEGLPKGGSGPAAAPILSWHRRRVRKDWLPLRVSVAESDYKEMRRQMFAMSVYSQSGMFRRMLWGDLWCEPAWESARTAPRPPGQGGSVAVSLNITREDMDEVDRLVHEFRARSRSEMVRILVWGHRKAVNWATHNSKDAGLPAQVAT